MNKTIVIGLDAACLDVITPWMEKGELPNLRRLMASGTYSELESIIPALTPPAWTSIATGKNPGKHGIFHFVKKKAGGHETELVTSSDVQARYIWEYLSEAGMSSVVINMPLTHPPRELRFVVQDTYARGHEKITVGRVESGVIRRGEEVIFQPSGAKGRIDEIRVFQGELERADKGDSIGIITNCEPQRGDVCGLVENPPIPATAFVGELVLLEGGLKNGDVMELKCGTRKVECEIEELREMVDSETGEVVRHFPASISEHDAAIIHFTVQPLVVERFSDIPELGRFVLVRGSNIGAGIVLETDR